MAQILLMVTLQPRALSCNDSAGEEEVFTIAGTLEIYWVLIAHSSSSFLSLFPFY